MNDARIALRYPKEIDSNSSGIRVGVTQVCLQIKHSADAMRDGKLGVRVNLRIVAERQATK